ncbi:Hypothetical protein PBC10988_21730 [Planctomycetales bacterium 10988]|nr:Hypothetical protein PBC10988_21730 [Planctomycetales bacterium 10988]
MNTSVQEDSQTECIVPEDQTWLISTRHLPTCGHLSFYADRMKFYRLEHGCWQSSDLETFLATEDPLLETWYAVHGNWMTQSSAISFGRLIHSMAKCRCGEGKGIRTVIWSWPADKSQARLRPDIQDKACKSDAQGYYMGWLIAQTQPQLPNHLVGYSLGARSICSALHLLEGGSYRGWVLDQPSEHLPPAKTLLIAAAMESCWLYPHGRFGMALNGVEKMVITKNTQDPVLRWYPLLEKGRSPEAMGYVGVGGLWSRPEVQQINVTNQVGKNHDWADYLRRSSILSTFCRLCCDSTCH